IFLIACKGDPELKKSGKKYENKKAIYSYDPATGMLSDTPYVLINVNDVNKFSRGHYRNAIEKLIWFYTRSGSIHVFEPSGIAIQPFTRQLYVISSVGKIMVVINSSGEVQHVIRLPESI